MPLTIKELNALKPKDKVYKLFDGGGLYIEVLTTGSKIWRIKYRLNGKDIRHTVGQYPLVSPHEARQALFQLKEKLAQGKPIKEAPDHVFKDVALEWLEKQTSRWSTLYKERLIRRMELYILPRIGTMPLSNVTPTMILNLINLLDKQGKHETAHRVLAICSQIMRYAVACGYCASNPCRDLQGTLTSCKPKPMAALTTPQAVAGLLRSILDYNGYMVVKEAMLWSAYTFCRPGEVRHAEWSEIIWEKKEWRIPAEKMKMRIEHRVPLARQCLEILERLKEQKFSDRWIFPSPRPGRPLSENAVLSALRRMGYTKDEMTAHGFRAMASTLLNEQGYRPDLIERQLAHGDTNKIRAIYNRAEYMAERRAMMQAWADYLDNLAQTQ